MDRRSFLKACFAAGSLTAINPTEAIEQFLTETNALSDTDFVTYVTFTMNLLVSNPAQCVVISNITE